MVIVGAKGHAKELLEVMRQDYPLLQLYFFDDVSTNITNDLYGYPILTTLAAIEQIFKQDTAFTLGIGGVQARYHLFNKFINMAGQPVSIASSKSYISTDVVLGACCSTMPFSSINNNVTAGKALLLNAYASVHHDSLIGNFVEIGPGARVLGGCVVGDFTFIGANATILPNVQIGTNVIVAAGAVVTRDVPANSMVAGNPAIIKKQLPPFNQ